LSLCVNSKIDVYWRKVIIEIPARVRIHSIQSADSRFDMTKRQRFFQALTVASVFVGSELSFGELPEIQIT